MKLAPKHPTLPLLQILPGFHVTWPTRLAIRTTFDQFLCQRIIWISWLFIRRPVQNFWSFVAWVGRRFWSRDVQPRTCRRSGCAAGSTGWVRRRKWWPAWLARLAWPGHLPTTSATTLAQVATSADDCPGIAQKTQWIYVIGHKQGKK